MKIEIETTEHAPDAMFFREAWLSGTGDDGTEVELTRTVGGHALVLQLDPPDGERVIHTIDVSRLLQAWAKAVQPQGKEKSA